jgi:hypothetical protein
MTSMSVNANRRKPCYHNPYMAGELGWEPVKRVYSVSYQCVMDVAL